MKEKMMALEKVNDSRPPHGRIHYSASVSALKPDDELVQAALAVLSNLMMVTNATSAEFEIGNPIDGVFRFTATHQKPAAPACARCGDSCRCASSTHEARLAADLADPDVTDWECACGRRHYKAFFECDECGFNRRTDFKQPSEGKDDADR